MSLTLVQVATSAAITSQTPAVAYTSNVTSGNLLVLTIGARGFHTDTATVSDSLGNTWTATAGKYVDTNEGYLSYIFHAVTASSGANTVTVTWANNVETNCIQLYEWNDSAAGTWVTTGLATGLDTQTTANPNVGSITTTASSSVIIATVTVHIGPPSAGSGWGTIDCATDFTGGGVHFFGSEHQIASAGTYSGAFVDAFSNDWCGAIAAWKSTGGVGASSFSKPLWPMSYP